MAVSEPDRTTVTVFFARTNFLARSLVSRLIVSSSSTVRLADPTRTEPNPFLPDLTPSSRTPSFSFSLSDPSPQTLVPSLAGSSAAFLFDPTLGSPAPFDPLNLYNLTVLTAKRVAAACRLAGVPRLVYSGSAEVDTGFNDRKSLGWLDEFREQAERIVLGSDGVDGLSTCLLRVCYPFGPGDGVFVPFLVRLAKLGLTKFVIGSGQNMCDLTYVENVAHANICAERALESDKTSVAGNSPIFITNHEPVNLWKFISNILEGLGYQRPGIHLPVKFVLHGALLVRWVCTQLGLGKACNPEITLAIIHMLSCTKTFDCSKAQRLIGYSPVVPLEDGVRSTVDSFFQLAAKTPIFSGERDFTSPSKADKLLGNGKVADMLLWRDEKKTFFCIMVLFFLRYWFILSGRTFVSSFAKLLLVVTVILFGHGHLPSSIFGYPLEKLHSSHFEVSEPVLRDLFLTVASAWNKGVCLLKSLAQGDDWNAFFKAVGSIYLLKLLLALPLSVLSGCGLICLFTLFIIYEQFELEVEKIITASTVGGKKFAGILIDKLPSSLLDFRHVKVLN
ncbi:hypothetical protein J5N97_022205 [Dioscorea zingiberensis]|uniref:Reticulon-like protein n=1 Tax=Dioscorea zingiberensis TaxID=325984 RepID=A0A9D5C9Y9_9LILI|nr:hypothetical protein J5N97_022205 [Dioscorea zingiberensis]